MLEEFFPNIIDVQSISSRPNKFLCFNLFQSHDQSRIGISDWFLLSRDPFEPITAIQSCIGIRMLKFSYKKLKQMHSSGQVTNV